MAIEEPEFEVIETIGDIEIRQYKSFIVAETVISSDKSRSGASNEGFRRLFNYISGNNTAREKIEMTAPVLQSGSEKNKGEKIEMTAPVQQTSTEEGWVVAFVLPLDYTMETAPVPGDERISLREIPGRTMAVKRFSGRWNDRTIYKHQKLLMEEVNEHDIEVEGDIEFAAYNAPFTLPFMRRNEVMIPLK
jgi:hypothetical protein